MNIQSYDDCLAWVTAAKPDSNPTLLLGNGFSMAYDAHAFSYSVLKDKATRDGLIGEQASTLFSELDTNDFEEVIKELQATIRVLGALNREAHEQTVQELKTEVITLKESLAKAIAGLHPDVHHQIADEKIENAKKFILKFSKIYTANYDMLLYWVLMRIVDDEPVDFRPTDGFREGRPGDDYVVWDNYDGKTQSIHYLHGALHLFQSESMAELQKLTWARTDTRLMDQVRTRLAENSFPLFVAEGTANDKKAKILKSDYLGRSLRSLAQISHGLVSYGLSFSDNDAHIADAIAKSKVSRVAISVFGNPYTEANSRLAANVVAMQSKRQALVESRHRRNYLEVSYFDAETARAW